MGLVVDAELDLTYAPRTRSTNSNAFSLSNRADRTYSPTYFSECRCNRVMNSNNRRYECAVHDNHLQRFEISAVDYSNNHYHVSGQTVNIHVHYHNAPIGTNQREIPQFNPTACNHECCRILKVYNGGIPPRICPMCFYRFY